MRVVLNTDGGVRTGGKNGPTQGRSGRASIGFVIRDPKTKVVLRKGGMLLEGATTVNEAEYGAVICGLYNAEKLGATHVTLRSDSQLVVMQLLGEWDVRHPHLQDYVDEVYDLMDKFDEVNIEWIPREANQHADSISRQYLDGKVVG